MNADFRFLNRTEERVYRALEEIASAQCLSVFPKVRFIDAFDERRVELSDAQKTFALKAHLDFLLVRADMTPFMAIEFDGPTHESAKQQARDATKNSLCEKSGLPLARIRSSYLDRSYGGMNALRWIVETTDLSMAFDDAQEAGQIAYDELFDPMMIASIGDLRRFPYWISADAQVYLNSLARKGIVRSFADIRGRSEDWSFHRAISIAELKTGEWVIKTASMREQMLPYHYADFLQMACLCEMTDKLRRVLAGEAKPIAADAALARLRVLCGDLYCGSGGGMGDVWMRVQSVFKQRPM